MRLALVTSVTWRRPPVSRQIKKESTVPKRISPAAARLRRPGMSIEQMLDFGAGEIGVDHEAGFLLDELFGASGFETIANGGADTALPDDGVGDGTAGGALPEDGGFALVGNAHGGDVGPVRGGFFDRLTGDNKLRVPNGLRIVLDDAWSGKDLRKFLLCDGSRAAVVREKNGAAGGGALVEGEDEFGHEARVRGSGYSSMVGDSPQCNEGVKG